MKPSLLSQSNKVLKNNSGRWWSPAPIKVPILDWLPIHSKQDYISDIIAGMTVFVLLIPQGMAYAILAGMPPVYGLYTATVPMYIYGMLGTSRQLSIGPFAITSLLLGTAVQAFGYPDGSPEYILIASNITMLVGLILYLLGALRMGELTNFLSQSVLTGFLTASASVILLSQCRYILGIKAPRMQYSHQTIIYLLTHLPETNGFSVLVGVSSFAALYGVKMWRQKNKLTDKASSLFRIIYLSTNAASIITILLGAGIAYAIATSSLNPRYHLQVVGKVPAGLKAPNFEMLEFQKVISLVPTSLVLAIISFTGNWAVAKRYAAINGYSVDATQELIATGMTNIFGALFNSFVSSGGLARSAVNAESGAKSPLSGCIAATLMILALLFFTPYFYYIPMCTLGAIIQVSVISMLDFPTMMETYRVDKRDCAVMVLTFLCTFFIGIQQGMFLGVVLSIGNVLRASAFPQIVHLGRVGNTVNYKDVFRNPDATQIPGIGIVRMDAALYFANCVHFKEVVFEVAIGKHHSSEDRIAYVIIDASAWTEIDLAGINTLFDIHADLLKVQVQLALACAKGPLRDYLLRGKFTERLGEGNIYPSIHDAVRALPRRMDTIDRDLASLQSSSALSRRSTLLEVRSFADGTRLLDEEIARIRDYQRSASPTALSPRRLYSGLEEGSVQSPLVTDLGLELSTSASESRLLPHRLDITSGKSTNSTNAYTLAAEAEAEADPGSSPISLREGSIAEDMRLIRPIGINRMPQFQGKKNISLPLPLNMTGLDSAQGGESVDDMIDNIITSPLHAPPVRASVPDTKDLSSNNL